LEQTDETQGDSAHDAAYTLAREQGDAKVGEVYCGTGISDLDSGVYVVDETNALIRLNSAEEAANVLERITKDTSFAQHNRVDVMKNAVMSWFEQH
jgi:hypothetical protein